jgi:hypothetical protein
LKRCTSFFSRCFSEQTPVLVVLQFWYLSQGENPIIDGVNDRTEFLATQGPILQNSRFGRKQFG